MCMFVYVYIVYNYITMYVYNYLHGTNLLRLIILSFIRAHVTVKIMIFKVT